MGKQVKIKDIAKMAGVSAGTVDRILHNRGNVSQASRKQVEKVLAEVGYKYNIHASAVAFRKSFKIVITMPSASIGEYWGSIQYGIDKALEEFSDIDVICSYAYYNQFDVYSCENAFKHICVDNPDAVIIGATFVEQTQELCKELDKQNIPYVFVDSFIEQTKPLASFSTDQYSCGQIIGKLLINSLKKEDEIAILRSSRIGNQESNNTLSRIKGLVDGVGNRTKIHECFFSVLDPDKNEKEVIDFINQHPKVKGIAVLNSRAHIIADLLYTANIQDIKLISFDLTYNNKRMLKSGYIFALLCQRPSLQGFQAVERIIHHLLYKQEEQTIHHKMPIDIIVKENLPFYNEII